MNKQHSVVKPHLVLQANQMNKEHPVVISNLVFQAYSVAMDLLEAMDHLVVEGELHLPIIPGKYWIFYRFSLLMN